jgi:hypothetical protein
MSSIAIAGFNMYHLAVDCIYSIPRVLRCGNTIRIAISMISRPSRYHRNCTALNISTTLVPDGVDSSVVASMNMPIATISFDRPCQPLRKLQRFEDSK